MKKTIVIIAVVLVSAGAGFYGGIQYQLNKNKSFQSSPSQTGSVKPDNAPTRNGNFQGNAPINGEIVSVEDGLVTIKTQDGSSKIIIYSSSTTINQTSEGSAADLKSGEQVTIMGTEGTDGTITAQSISIGGNYFRQVPENEISE